MGGGKEGEEGLVSREGCIIRGLRAEDKSGSSKTTYIFIKRNIVRVEIEKDTYTSKYYILLTNFATNVYGPKERGGGEMVRGGERWGGVKGRGGGGEGRGLLTHIRFRYM